MAEANMGTAEKHFRRSRTLYIVFVIVLSLAPALISGPFLRKGSVLAEVILLLFVVLGLGAGIAAWSLMAEAYRLSKASSREGKLE